MRVLHIYSDPALTHGASTFEYRIAERLKAHNIYFDYLVTEPLSDPDRERYEANGSCVHTIPLDKKHGLFVRELKANRQYYRFFKENHYDIVYADTENSLRAFHLLMARFAGVPVRVLHSHNTGLQTRSRFSILLSRILRSVFRFSVTDYFACSDVAASWLFPASVCRKHRYQLLNNGVDLNTFHFDPDTRTALRERLGIEDAFVIGNVGRFMPQKNQKLLIEILAALRQKIPKAQLLLIGDGPLRAELEQHAKDLGVFERIIFTGNVPDVYNYMCAMDMFVMTSLHEGLPIVAIEAQAAGLPCILSDSITDSVAITDRVAFAPLEGTPDDWISKIQSLRSKRDSGDPDAIRRAGYSIEDTAAFLLDFYTRRSEKV